MMHVVSLPATATTVLADATITRDRRCDSLGDRCRPIRFDGLPGDGYATRRGPAPRSRPYPLTPRDHASGLSAHLSTEKVDVLRPPNSSEPVACASFRSHLATPPRCHPPCFPRSMPALLPCRAGTRGPHPRVPPLVGPEPTYCDQQGRYLHLLTSRRRGRRRQPSRPRAPDPCPYRRDRYMLCLPGHY